MKTLIATAAFVGLLMTGTAYAAHTLNDAQMDTVTAGVQVIPNNLVGNPIFVGPSVVGNPFAGPTITFPGGESCCYTISADPFGAVTYTHQP